MWPGFDPHVVQALATLRLLVALQRQTPTREWPLVFVQEHDAILILREWPDGSITAYAAEKNPA